MKINLTFERIFKALGIIFIIFCTICMLIGYELSAQTAPKVQDKVLKDTTINKVVHKLYAGSRGGKYIIVVSKSGNTYKKYFK